MADLEGDKIDVDSEGASCQVDILPPDTFKNAWVPQWSTDVGGAVAELFSVKNWFVLGAKKVTFSFCGAAMNAELAADSFTFCFTYAWQKASQLPAGMRTDSYLRGFGAGMLEKSSADEARQRRDCQKAKTQKACAKAAERAKRTATAAAAAAEEAQRRAQALQELEQAVGGGVDTESETGSGAGSGESGEDSGVESDSECDHEEAEEKQVALYKGNALAFAKRVEVEFTGGEKINVHRVDRAAGKKDRAAYEKGKADGAQCEHSPMKRLRS